MFVRCLLFVAMVIMGDGDTAMAMAMVVVTSHGDLAFLRPRRLREN